MAKPIQKKVIHLNISALHISYKQDNICCTETVIMKSNAEHQDKKSTHYKIPNIIFYYSYPVEA